MQPPIEAPATIGGAPADVVEQVGKIVGKLLDPVRAVRLVRLRRGRGSHRRAPRSSSASARRRRRSRSVRSMPSEWMSTTGGASFTRPRTHRRAACRREPSFLKLSFGLPVLPTGTAATLHEKHKIWPHASYTHRADANNPHGGGTGSRRFFARRRNAMPGDKVGPGAGFVTWSLRYVTPRLSAKRSSAVQIEVAATRAGNA